MRKAASIVCLIILVLGLSSCYDANEIDDMLHVVTIGVDQGISNKWRLSLQFSTMKEPNGGGEESSGESKSKGEYASVTIDAPSFFTGIDMLNASLPRKLTFAHAQFIVFSEELAESGLIGEYIAPIKRFKEIRDTAHIFVIKGKAEKFLKENQPFVGNMLSKNFEMFINEGDNTGFFPRVTLENFYSGIISTYHQPIAPLAAINDFKAFQKEGEPFGTEFNQGGHYIAGELPRSGENKIELFGTALFDEDTMVGQLDGDETRYMLMARGDFKRGFFTMKDPKKPELIIPLDITASRKPKTKVTFDDTKPVIHLKIHLDVDLLAVQSRINYEEAELRALLEEEFKKTVKDGVEKVIQKCQSLHTDVFMFGDYAARNFLTIDDLENYDWNNHFKDAKAVVEVEVTIRRTGTQIGSYQMNEEGDV